jgi:hypothetical protein
VRVSWQGQIFSGFFADKKYGGRPQALAVAQEFYLTLRKKLGLPAQRDRRWWAETVRRRGKSGIQGVSRMINRRVKPWRKYWVAKWSPELGIVRKKQFSIRIYGEEKAKQLAIRARRAGVRSMK